MTKADATNFLFQWVEFTLIFDDLANSAAPAPINDLYSGITDMKAAGAAYSISSTDDEATVHWINPSNNVAFNDVDNNALNGSNPWDGIDANDWFFSTNMNLQENSIGPIGFAFNDANTAAAASVVGDDLNDIDS